MLQKLIDIAREGGDLALKMKNEPLERTIKDGNAWNIVTQADLAVQKLIIRGLTHAFPETQIVGEEQDEHYIPKGDFFTIDPIDGTIAYAHGFTNWGPIIGHIVNGQPQHGVMYLPENNIMVATQKNKGCTINGKPVTINHTKILAESVVGIDIGPWITDDKWSAISRLRLKCQWLGGSGMATANITDILLGRTAAYPNFFAKIWDFSAGALAITETGGVAIQPDGQPLQWNKVGMQALFAANQSITDEMLAIINA